MYTFIVNIFQWGFFKKSIPETCYNLSVYQVNTKTINCTDLTIPFLFQLTELMTGVYDDISSFQIIDCRYPYEFEGGHIQVLTYFL